MGVMEYPKIAVLKYWSVGVMGKSETQYSITPPLQYANS
jgi:hypothetical protein